MAAEDPLVAALRGLSGWWARRAVRRFVERPDRERLAALVQRVRGGHPELLGALGAALMAGHARLFLAYSMPGLSDDELARLLPTLGSQILLNLRVRPADVEVELRTERGEAVFRSVRRELRREVVDAVKPWRLGRDMACPRCDGTNLRGGKDTSSGRDIRDYYCADCRWLYCEDLGPSLSSLLYPVEDRAPAPAPARTGDVLIKLVVTDGMGYYDDSLGTYVGDPDASRRTTNTWWFRVPAAWLDAAGGLPKQRLTAMCGHLYGEDWLYSRERARYMVYAADVQVVAIDDADKPWAAAHHVDVWTEDGVFRSRAPDQLDG